MNESRSPLPYSSAADLPSVQKLRTGLRGLRLLGFAMNTEQRKEIKRIRAQLDELTSLVDHFYEVLGPRNWVLSDSLDLNAIREMLHADDPEETERRLIDYYQSSGYLSLAIGRLHHHTAMRPRMELIKKASIDYREGRYYSTILVLITVLDGFVNDINTGNRKGLHSRDAGKMVAWDSVAGHHMGLSHALEPFLKSFQRTRTETIFEVHRHGIIHGNLVDFDNVVVATKAWNLLFAVSDWADSLEKTSHESEPQPTILELIKSRARIRGRQELLDEWNPYRYLPEDDIASHSTVLTRTRTFLEDWSAKRWGPVGQYFLQFGQDTPTRGKLAYEARTLYTDYVLDTWTLGVIRHTGAGRVEVEANLVVNGEEYQSVLRWVRSDGKGNVAIPEWEEGEWLLAPYGPTVFLKDKCQDTAGE